MQALSPPSPSTQRWRALGLRGAAARLQGWNTSVVTLRGGIA